MLGFCKIHNKPEFTNVSIRLREILKTKEVRGEKMVKVLVVPVNGGVEGEAYTFYMTDYELLGFTNPSECLRVILYDRDKINKEPNDRMAIAEIRRNTVQLCRDCFMEVSRIMNFL